MPEPAYRPSDVLVGVDLVAANPVGTYVRSGAYPTRTPFPFVVERDLVGTIVAAGEGAAYSAGDQVWCNEWRILIRPWRYRPSR